MTHTFDQLVEPLYPDSFHRTLDRALLPDPEPTTPVIFDAPTLAEALPAVDLLARRKMRALIAEQDAGWLA